MQVKGWTGSDGVYHEEEITIEIDILSLLPDQIDDMVKILEEYAASGKDLTLYGLSEGSVLSEGATLQLIGLGKGEFTAHPFDFEGEKPISLSVGEEDYAEFVAMMNRAAYQGDVYKGMSQTDKAKTYRELYLALMNGNLKAGGSITTSTGVTFRIVVEGSGTRLDGTTNKLKGTWWDGWVPMRHFSDNLAKQLKLR